MKKIIVISLLLVTASAFAWGMLIRQETRGMKRYCYYNDGTILTIDAFQSCPSSIK
jgi:hypothetical protein